MDMDPSHSALNTGAGLPWGTEANRMDMDISHSALNTGQGTIWGPGERGKTTTTSAPSPYYNSPSASPLAGRGPRPTNNTAGEDNFRSTYLSALKPSTTFTFNAQNPTVFGKGGK
jgi:hypothetical protein